MSAGVLLRYAGGEVYALPTADRHVWRVAGVEVCVDMVGEHAETGEVIGLETLDDLATAAVWRRYATGSSALRPGEVDAAIANAEAVLAKYERPQAKRPTKSKRTGKGRAKR